MAYRSLKALKKSLLLFFTLVWLQGCSIFIPKEAGIGDEVSWKDLPGWSEDNVSEAWPALLSQCVKLGKKPTWDSICQGANQLSEPSDAEVRSFLQDH
ncbi:MAG: hypothetical protein ABW082_16950, partial [Sedimenticola sp.]